MRKRTRKTIVAAAGLTTALTGLVAVHHAEPLGVLGGGGHNKALAAEQKLDASRITVNKTGDKSLEFRINGTVNSGDYFVMKVQRLLEGGERPFFMGIRGMADSRIMIGDEVVGNVSLSSGGVKFLFNDAITKYADPTISFQYASTYTNWFVSYSKDPAKRKVDTGLDLLINDTIKLQDYTRHKSGAPYFYDQYALINWDAVVDTENGRIKEWFRPFYFNSRDANGETKLKDNELIVEFLFNTDKGKDTMNKLLETSGFDFVYFKDAPDEGKLADNANSSLNDYVVKTLTKKNGLVIEKLEDADKRIKLRIAHPNLLEGGHVHLLTNLTNKPGSVIGDDGYAKVQDGRIIPNPDLLYTVVVHKKDGSTERFTRAEGGFHTPSSASANGRLITGSITPNVTNPDLGDELIVKKGDTVVKKTKVGTGVINDLLPGEYKVSITPKPGKTITGNEEKTVVIPPNGGNQDVSFTLADNVKTNVSVQVVDEAGKAIRPTKTVFAEAKPEGTQYSVRKPRIAGYRFVRAEGELAGTLGKTDKTVKLVYKADSSVVAGTDPDTIEERKERVVPIPFETETRDNPELWQGEERVINPGAEGAKTIITTRQLDENQQPVGDPVVTENVTKQPVKRVVERGTKNPAGTETVTTEKPKPFKTETRDNPDLYEGDERVVTEGKDGVTTVTTVYKTNKGKRTGDNPTVTETEKQPPVNRVVERGTKDPNGIDTVKEHEDVVYKTEYRDNPELYEGETRVIQEGELGSNVITKQYKTKKGKRTDDEPVVTKKTEKEPKNRIIERGTKPVAGVDTVVEDKELPFKLVIKDNPELTEGEERVVIEGIPGLVKKTTVYKTEKGKRVGDPTVTETVVKEPIDRVVEKGTKPKTPKQTDADKNNPKGKDQTVFVGEKPDPKNSIDNYNDLPKGTVVKWEKDPDTATPGQKPSILLFEYPDGSIEKVSVIVTAIPKPEPKDQTVFVGETPKAEDSIGNYPQLPEGTRVSWLVPPKTDKPGVVDGVVLIEYPDGRRVEVPVKVTVVEKEKEKQPPQQEQNNNGENGNNKDKDKVSDNSDNSDKDTKKDKPTPQGKDQTVKVGENPLVQDSIGNNKDLPKGTKLSWEKTPDTTKPGVIEVVVLVEYPDGTSERVTVRITVVDDSDKNKEKDNHENDNKTNPNTNTKTDADNNKTPDKKELNENKQPDRKESIKTGVGSVDQTAAGVALTATALALSAFALRRRKQQ